MMGKLSILTTADEIVEVVLDGRKPAESSEMLKMPMPTVL